MYMIEEMGMEKFRETVVDYAKRVDAAFEPQAAAPAPKEAYPRRSILGVHPQKQEGKSWVCVTTPAGRLMPQDVSEMVCCCYWLWWRRGCCFFGVYAAAAAAAAAAAVVVVVVVVVVGGGGGVGVLLFGWPGSLRLLSVALPCRFGAERRRSVVL